MDFTSEEAHISFRWDGIIILVMRKVLLSLSVIFFFQGCGLFMGVDSQGYNFGISINDVSERGRDFSSLYVKGHSRIPPAVGLVYNRFLFDRGFPLAVAPGGGVEVLFVGRDERRRIAGVGLEMGLEIVPMNMYRHALRAGEGSFMWMYIRPYITGGYLWEAGDMYWMGGVQVGFRIKQVYSF